MISIRFATAQDVPIILTLIKELAEFERLAHEVVATEATLKKTLFGEHKTAEVVLAERNGETLGSAIFFHNFSTFLGRPGLYLEDLYVRPQYRGEGIGQALLTHLAQVAVERDCGRMEWAVLDWNQKAIDFYLKLGAQPMDDWTVFRLSGDKLKTLAD